MLQLAGLNHRVYKLDEDFDRESFYGQFGNGSTFPQVVMDDIPLGGCQESLKYMQENNLCCEIP